MSDRDWVVSHLFMATPQLFANDKTLRRMRSMGLITKEQYSLFHQGNASIEKMIGSATSGRNLIRRILAINPGQLDEDFISLLRLGNLISKKNAHRMRLMLRSQNALKGRMNDATIFTRYRRLFGVGYSEESINLMRSMKMINVHQADAYRFLVLTTKITAETVPRLIHAKNWVDMLLLAGDGLVDDRTIRALKYAGLLDARSADRLEAAVLMGRANWQAFHDAGKVEGFAQRLAYAASGSFNHETIRFLRLAGIITRKQELILRPAVMIGLGYQRHLQEKWTQRRYRPVHGEAPIKTFAKASKKTDDELLRLLSLAADDAKKTAAKLDRLDGKKIGGVARSTQYKAVTRELHDQMQRLWEGHGYLTIYGQHEAARASYEANEVLMMRLTKHLPKETQFMMAYNARAGVDSYVSRQENLRALSRMVYGNYALYTGKIDQKINIALLQGKSARELALDISQYIKPGVPGGVSYAAMRLARTELQNAFHFTTIRYTREMPWVQAYKWNLSGSHSAKRPDICDDFAHDDHGTGNAGEFKKKDVPPKPHPQCFCYITVVDIGEDEFFRLYKQGYYSRYLKQNAMKTPDAENSWLHDGVQSAFTHVGG